MSDAGQRLVQVIADQAEAATLPAAQAAVAYARVTRSVRQNIMLDRKLSEPLKTADRVAARKRIIRAVEDTIQRDDLDESEMETLHEELLDRLESLELEDEIGDRPVDDIIIDIVRDLGLAAVPGNHPWKRRTPADIAELCARAAQPIAPTANTAIIARPPGENPLFAPHVPPAAFAPHEAAATAPHRR